MRKLVLLLLAFFCLVDSQAWSQQQDSSVMDESMRDVSIVLGTTAVGATLGLSTLSFVEEPGQHLKNVIVGGALGIIVGVGIVAYMQASKSRNLYLEGAEEEAPPEASVLKLEEVNPMANASDYYQKKSGGKQIPFFTFSYTF
ncbi:MAG: hypothetical protein HYV97_16280 [Bdellovibrio sp.]|nr:hypothetical protein [Bdellovibrio sp.]